ncbi:hypothetical protein M0R19_01255 [Candidatus Pacearchaeota archaeon]|jgi:hypothetical protein|nr:hypothetical protein [Candidatus Pacearchaeota archaeon]
MGKLRNILYTSLILLGIGCGPNVKEVKDLTGDGLQDVKIEAYNQDYIFVNKGDGTYLRTVMFNKNEGKVKWIQEDRFTTTLDKKPLRVFVYDGKNYIESE